MNRRNTRFLILLPLSLGVVGLFAGREMASWRPQRLVRFPYGPSADFGELSVSNRAVMHEVYPSVASLQKSYFMVDARTGKLLKTVSSSDAKFGIQNDFNWKQTGDPFSIEVLNEKNQKKKFSSFPPFEPTTNQCLRILPDQNRVVAMNYSELVEWKFREGTLKRRFHLSGLEDNVSSGLLVLSHDAKRFVSTNERCFLTGDTATGKILSRTPARGEGFFDGVELSPHGRYGMFNRRIEPTKHEIVETATGKILWELNGPSSGFGLRAMSDDETTLIVAAGKEWQVRSFATGEVLRRLPLVPGGTLAALSPDGATLYSVANGILYRQRAR